MGGAGWTDLASLLPRPTELRNFLSEDELKPPRRQRAMSYPKLGTRSEHTPRARSQFSLRDENVPMRQAARKGRPVILLSCSHQQSRFAGIITWSLIFPSGNPGGSNSSTGYTAGKWWSCSVHQVCLIPKLSAPHQMLEVTNG